MELVKQSEWTSNWRSQSTSETISSSIWLMKMLKKVLEIDSDKTVSLSPSWSWRLSKNQQSNVCLHNRVEWVDLSCRNPAPPTISPLQSSTKLTRQTTQLCSIVGTILLFPYLDNYQGSCLPSPQMKNGTMLFLANIVPAASQRLISNRCWIAPSQVL